MSSVSATGKIEGFAYHLDIVTTGEIASSPPAVPRLMSGLQLVLVLLHHTLSGMFWEALSHCFKQRTRSVVTIWFT